MATGGVRLFDLRDTVSVVTGGTGHLGRAMCEALAAAGANIAVCSTSLEQGQTLARDITERHGVVAEGFKLDLREIERLPDVVDEIVQRFGGIDCLVNNACFGAANELLAMTPKEWTQGLHGAATTALFMMQACMPYLEAAAGNVINISSMYGMVSPDPHIYEDTEYGNPVNYGAGKAALLQLTRYAAVHLAPKGVRVNAVSPGPFPNPEVQQHKVFIERLERKVPLGRIGQPEEASGAVVFLASRAASYVTGHNLIVDGGWTIW